MFQMLISGWRKVEATLNKQKQLSVLIDTSYLITLLDKTRDNNQAALSYQKYFVEQKFELFLSTIVITEFHQKQDIKGVLELNVFNILPYNFEDARATGGIISRYYDLVGIKDSFGNQNRAQFKDDFKIIGQAKNNNVDFIITDDTRTLSKYIETLNNHKVIMTNIIKLRDGFDISHFNGGQKPLI